MIRCRECGSLCEDHDERDACERGDQTKAAIDAARADGAAAERARLREMVEARRALVERKRDRALSEHSYQRAATLDSEEYAYRDVLEAMGAAEGSEAKPPLPVREWRAPERRRTGGLMTTKKELREALQRLADAAEKAKATDRSGCICRHCLTLRRETADASAILARPAVVVGYRVRGAVSGRAADFRLGQTSMRADGRPYAELWECMGDAMTYQEEHGGVVRKLVAR